MTEQEKKYFDELTRKRNAWVDISEENGFYCGIKNLLAGLYPDKAHFIYELLQNAEDAFAKNVRFIMFADRLVFEHNGRKAFDIKDIEGITSIADSPKVGDKTKIGKFGIGFKSVFAYCSIPEIHTDDYSFCIKDMVIPEKISKFSDRQLGWTKFIFPFDNSVKAIENSINEIEKGLIDLKGETILFLNNIKSIEYVTIDGRIGMIEKDSSSGIVNIDCIFDEENHLSGNQHWLKFDKTVEIECESEQKECNVSIAFALEKDIDENEENYIIAPTNGTTNIYFPAKKETSNLRFLIHAPFASTVARDSINDDSSNDQLLEELAVLLAESMLKIKDLEMLDKNIFKVLPNSDDCLDDRYNVFYKNAIEVFKNEKIIPIRSSERSTIAYEHIDNVVSANRDVRRLFSEKDLRIVSQNEKLSFLDTLPIDDDGYQFIKDLEIKLFNNEVFIKLFEEKENITPFNCFFKSKDDEWLKKCYAFMHNGIINIARKHKLPYSNSNELDKILTQIKEFSIVRVEEDGSDSMTTPQVARFVDAENIKLSKHFRRVKNSVFLSSIAEESLSKTDSRKFLEEIGVAVYGLEDIEQEGYKLKYDDICKKLNHTTQENAIDVIKALVSYYKSDANRCYPIANLSSAKVLLAVDENENDLLASIQECVLDMPYENTGLGAYIPIVNKYIVSNSYFEKLNSDDLPIFINILKQNSVQHELLVEKISCKDNQLLKDKYSSSYYSTQVDIDFSIKKLEYLIANISESIARLIWNACKKGCENHYYDITRGTFKLNQQHQKYFAISQLVQKLKDARWIPTKIGEFKKPCDVLRDEMPDDFCLDLKHCNEKYEKFLKEIGFEKNREYGEGGKEEPDEIDKLTQRMCELFGVSRLTREDLERYIRTLREEKVQPDFPIKVVNNPFRRSQKIKEEYMNARSKQYKEIKRSIRVSDGDIKPKHYLNDNYKNDDSEVICQICEQEMPFKKNGGEHYFECVEIFDKDSFSKEHQAMYLALCPSCAAKYKRYVKEAVNKSVRLFNILTQIEEFDFNSSQDFIIKISLDEEGTVRFTEQHLRDVQTLVKEDM